MAAVSSSVVPRARRSRARDERPCDSRTRFGIVSLERDQPVVCRQESFGDFLPRLGGDAVEHPSLLAEDRHGRIQRSLCHASQLIGTIAELPFRFGRDGLLDVQRTDQAKDEDRRAGQPPGEHGRSRIVACPAHRSTKPTDRIRRDGLALKERLEILPQFSRVLIPCRGLLLKTLDTDPIEIDRDPGHEFPG